MAQLTHTWRTLATSVAFGALPPVRFAQATMAPVNDAPNPYTTVENHFKLPEGPHVGLDQRGGHRPRRQVDLGGRALRRQQLLGSGQGPDGRRCR